MNCIVCKRTLENIDPRGNQPDGGLEFVTLGHYGSTEFDPMDGSCLAVNICDQCLSTERAAGNILLVRPAVKTTKRIYSVWSEA